MNILPLRKRNVAYNVLLAVLSLYRVPDPKVAGSLLCKREISARRYARSIRTGKREEGTSPCGEGTGASGAGTTGLRAEGTRGLELVAPDVFLAPGSHARQAISEDTARRARDG